MGNGDHEMTTSAIPTEGRNECSTLRVVNLIKDRFQTTLHRSAGLHGRPKEQRKATSAGDGIKIQR